MLPGFLVQMEKDYLLSYRINFDEVSKFPAVHEAIRIDYEYGDFVEELEWWWPQCTISIWLRNMVSTVDSVCSLPRVPSKTQP